MHTGALTHRPVFIVGMVACGVLASAGALLATESPGATDLKTQADRWIELEKRIADERGEWRSQKEVLTASVEVLEKERQTLQSRMEANELAERLFNTKVENARAELADHETGHALLNRRLGELEQRLQTLLPRLPEPLQAKIAPLLDSANTGTDEAVADRARRVTAALTAVDQFNNGLTLTHHLRTDNGSGDVYDVKVLYWGLATGYGIDARGTRAWTLTPTATGWEWREEPERVKEIRTLFAVYEKQQNPKLVMLPVGSEGGAK